MKALIVSRALLSSTYRLKLTEMVHLGIHVVAVVPPSWREGGVEQHLEQDGTDTEYDLIVLPVRFNGHFHAHYYPGLRHLIHRFRPDLVHMDEEPYNLATFLGCRASSAERIPSLFFSWQNLARRYPPPYPQIERSVYRQAVHAIAGSREVATVLRTKGFTKEVSIIPQFGVDPDVFSPAERPPEAFTVGFLNRLIAAKAPLLTLDAFLNLPPDARLKFVGDGPLRVELLSKISLRDGGCRITWQPRLPSAAIPRLMRQLSVVVLPSLTTPTWKEQFGRVLIEAMASGVPVVGSDSGEIPEVVGDAGLIVPEGNVEALGAALQLLYHDQDLRTDLARRGRRRVVELFTHARIAELTRLAYESALQTAQAMR